MKLQRPCDVLGGVVETGQLVGQPVHWLDPVMIKLETFWNKNDANQAKKSFLTCRKSDGIPSLDFKPSRTQQSTLLCALYSSTLCNSIAMCSFLLWAMILNWTWVQLNPVCTFYKTVGAIFHHSFNLKSFRTVMRAVQSCHSILASRWLLVVLAPDSC